MNDILTEHKLLVLKTANSKLTHQQQLANAAIGLCGEAGEVADLLKKHLFQEKSLDISDLKKEMGDVMWYMSYLALVVGVDLNSVIQGNIDKLMARYPNGFRPRDEIK